MSNLQAYDKVVKENCGTFSLLERAQTGYASLHQFTEAFDDLYSNPQIQRDFGVEELAYMKSKPADILNHLKTDHLVSEGEARFTASFEPKIEEGQFVRQAPIFNKDGKYSAPPIDVNDPNNSAELTRLRQLLERREASERLLVEREASESAFREADRIPATELKKYHREKLQDAGMLNRSKEALLRAGFKYGVGDFNNNLSAEQQREYVIDRFFNNDPEAFLEWNASQESFFPDPRMDLFAAGAFPEPPPAGEGDAGGSGESIEEEEEDSE